MKRTMAVTIVQGCKAASFIKSPTIKRGERPSRTPIPQLGLSSILIVVGKMWQPYYQACHCHLTTSDMHCFFSRLPMPKLAISDIWNAGTGRPGTVQERKLALALPL